MSDRRFTVCIPEDSREEGDGGRRDKKTGGGTLSDIRERVSCALHTLDVLLLQQMVYRLYYSFERKLLRSRKRLHTFFMSGSFGWKRCEICAMTSWMS